ncbi:MAG: flippase [Eubacteriales bacterium]|nr:flippase [Eubacteriales bacterium]
MKKSSIKMNVLYQLVYEVFAMLIPLLTAPYVSRILGAEKLGIYSYWYSVASYFGMVAMLGVKNYGNREIAKNRENIECLTKTFWSIYAVQCGVSVIVLIAYMIFIFCFSSDNTGCSLVFTLYVISCMLDISWFFFGTEQFKITSARNTIIKLITASLVFLCVRSADDILLYCGIMAGGCLASQLILWVQLSRYICYTKIHFNQMLSHFKPMLILFIPVLAVSLYCIMDKIMIGNLSNKTQLGFYEASEKITTCVKSVITAFGTVMMPRMSKLFSDGDIKAGNRYMSLSVEIMMAVAFAMAFGISSVAHIFAPLFWGEEFIPCAGLLIALSAALPFEAFADIIRTQYLIPNSMDKAYIVSVMTGGITNVTANLILIPRMGALGAAVGTIIAEIMVWLVQCIFVRNKIHLEEYLQKAIPFGVMGGIMMLVLRAVDTIARTTVSWVILEVIIGIVVYCSLSFTYFYKTKNELLINFLKTGKNKLRNK